MASLEGLAGELAAARVTDADLDDLKRFAGRHGEGPPAGAICRAYYRVNRAIHDRLNLIAANPVLAQTYRTLNARLHALRFRSNLNGAKWDRRWRNIVPCSPPLRHATALGYVTCSSGTCTPSFRRCWRR